MSVKLAPTFLVVVTRAADRLVIDHAEIPRGSCKSNEGWEKRIHKEVNRMYKKYPRPEFRIHQGSAQNVETFLSIYPEVGHTR